jgi:hypothetical protein
MSDEKAWSMSGPVTHDVGHRAQWHTRERCRWGILRPSIRSQWQTLGPPMSLGEPATRPLTASRWRQHDGMGGKPSVVCGWPLFF